MKKILFSLLMGIPLVMQSQTTILSENFDSGTIPSTWTIQKTDVGYSWQAENSTGNYTATVLFDPAPANQNEWLITPGLNFSDSTKSYDLKFDVKLSYYWSVSPYNNYDVFVKVSTDNGANWTQVWSEDSLGTFGNFVTVPVSIDLSSYKGNTNLKVAFQYVGNDGAALYVDNVLIQSSSPATSAPSCPTLLTPANSATNVDYQSAVSLTWQAASTGDPATSYDVYMDTNANPTTLKTNTTSTSYSIASGLNPSTTYYWKIVPKNSIGSATGCQVFSFTTMAPTYCTAGATSTSFEKISNVTFAGINNNSTSTAGYEDFTAVEGNVNAGSSYPFSANFTGTSFNDDQVIVWIDFNQDKTFSNDERVLITTPGKAPWTGTINIPTTALTGKTRMRVRLHDSVLTPNATPCGTSSYGQVEDYSINISPALGVQDVSKAGLQVYPNPVKNIVNIEMKSKIKAVQIFDAAGKLIMTHSADQSKTQINLEKLNSGVYLMKVQMNDGSSVSSKVIKE